MHCINCPDRVDWIFTNSGVAPQRYCGRHLPAAYRGLPGLSEATLEPEAAEPEVEPLPKPRARQRKASAGSVKE